MRRTTSPVAVGPQATERIEALLEERVEQLANLTELSVAVARAENLDEACGAALDCLARTLSASRASILLFDAHGVMRFRAWRGLSDEYRSATDGHSPWTAETVDPEPVLVPDIADEPSLAVLRPVIEAEGIRALGFFPLVDRERLLGKFMVYFESPHSFSEIEVQLAQAIGAQVALEIARSKRETETSLLVQVSRALAPTMSANEVVDVLVREATASLSAAAGWIAEVDEESWELRRLGAAGYRADLEESYARLSLDLHNPTVAAVRTGEPRWFETAEQLDDQFPGLAADYAQAGFEAMAVAPLMVAGRAMGVIALNFKERRTFRDGERRLLVALADQCGQALERARLYAELQDRADAVSVLAHVGDGVFELGPDERVLLWNRGATVITGIDELQALDHHITDLIPDWESIQERISITQVPLAVGRREAVPAQVGKRDLWLAISGVASGDNIVYAFRDVTESERLEKARRDFLATASHELRTPLAGVFGAAKTLLHRRLDEQTRTALLGVIESQTDRLAQILDELLYASRLDAGLSDVVLDDCDLEPLVDEIVTLERSRLPAFVTLTAEVAASLPRVRCDPVRVRQVLVNLLDNAIKYSPDGGAIRVTLARDGDTARISVADEGIGVPHGEHERIFEKFYRLDPALTRGVGGTGLGLYISRQYIRQMHGRLWMEAGRQKGSTFHVELPVASR